MNTRHTILPILALTILAVGCDDPDSIVDEDQLLGDAELAADVEEDVEEEIEAEFPASDAPVDDLAVPPVDPQAINLLQPNSSKRAIKLSSPTNTGTQAVVTTAAVPQTNITIEAWFRTFSKTRAIFGTCTDDGFSTWCDRNAWIDANGNVCSHVNRGNLSPVKLCTANKNYADGKWHLVTITLGASGFKLFLDAGLSNGGKTVSNANVTTSALTEKRFHIGNTLNELGNGPMNTGPIDIENVRIWKQANSEMFTNSYANVGVYGTNAAVLGEYRMDTTTGTTAVNSITHAAKLPNGALTGSYTWIAY